MNTRSWKSTIGLLLLGAMFVSVSGCSDSKSVAPQVPLIKLSATSLQFASLAGSVPNPAAQHVIVTNIGVGHMTFNASTDCSWITLLPVDDSDVLVTVRSEALATGSYADSVVFISTQASNSPVYLPVLLTVQSQIAPSPTGLFFSALAGGTDPDSQVVQLTALGGTDISYSATCAAGWISLQNATGTTPGELIVQTNLSGLAGGIYQTTITVTSPEVPDLHVQIAVRLAVSSWSQRISTGHSFVLRGVTFVDSQHGWASGYLPHATWPHAVLCRTDDGGATWEMMTSGLNGLSDAADGAYEGLAFTDMNKGWIAGDNAHLIRTTNGGDTWSLVNGLPINASVSLVNLEFATRDSGWLIGSDGTVLATTDSGNTWHGQTSNAVNDLCDLWFIDSRQGWVCGNHGTILHTANGGTSWSSQTTPSTSDLRGVCFVDANHGWAVGEGGTMIRTTNGGATWSALAPVVDVLLLDVFFVSQTRGWAVGYDGLILQTADGGDTWEQQQSGTNSAIFDIYFLDANIGVVVGQEGVLLRTMNGGF